MDELIVIVVCFAGGYALMSLLVVLHKLNKRMDKRDSYEPDNDAEWRSRQVRNLPPPVPEREPPMKSKCQPDTLIDAVKKGVSSLNDAETTGGYRMKAKPLRQLVEDYLK